ncbi:MAG: anti-sigma factor [Alphaproteobacteria bacterium]|nr:anti-sigma factor [Alphaproteobacteria bacterium]
MRYDSPELRDRLAAEYVLGTLPIRARRRFERLMAGDPDLVRSVGNWSNRLLPLDEAVAEEEPPARVWRAIESRVRGITISPPPSASAAPWFGALVFWRSAAIAAGAAAAALAVALYIALSTRPAPVVVAVLAGPGGEPGWVAVRGPKPDEVSFSAVAPKVESEPHAFELWGIAGAAPHALGLLPQVAGSALGLRASQLPPPGGVLAVSLEPPAGSATGLPTGPVLYQGKVLSSHR